MSQACQCVTPQKISDNTTGEIICKNCGVILESHTIGHSMSNERNTTQRHDYGIGTEPPKIKVTHNVSLRMSQRESPTNRRTKELFQIMSPMLQKISATQSINNDACFLARKCVSYNLSKGRTRIDVAAACVLASCKINGKVITEKEITLIGNVSKKSTRRIYRMILEKFEVKTIPVHQLTINLISRICSDLGISQKIMIQSLDLLEKIKQKNIGISSHPGTVAGTMVYLSCDGMVSRVKIAKISGVTTNSLRNFTRKIKSKTCQ